MAEPSDHWRSLALHWRSLALRRRNIALACIAAVAAVAAVLRLSLGTPPQAPATAAAASVSAAREAPNGAAADAVRAFHIPVHLALASGVDLPFATTVFLIVRSPGGGGMPLAVKRMTVADLPADVSLSDADVMIADTSLRAVDVVELVARASVSGDVRAGPGDYEGTTGTLRVAAILQPITLIIDRPL